MSKKFINYTFFGLIERGILFLSPLIILQISGNSEYIKFEYILALTAIISPVVDLGVKPYLLVEFSKKDGYINVIYVYKWYILITLITALCFYLINYKTHEIYLNNYAAYFRSLLLAWFGVVIIEARLKNSPSKSYFYTIPYSILALLVPVSVQKFLNIDFITSYIWLNIFYLLLCIIPVNKIKFTDIIFIYRIPKSSIYIIISTVMAMIMLNYGRIYVENNFKDRDMINFSLTQRFALIIQIMHASYVGFFSKDIYKEVIYGLKSNLYKKYLKIISITCLFSVFLQVIYYKLFEIKLDMPTIIFMYLYIFFWCSSSYWEAFYSRKNLNIVILAANVLSLFLYLIGLLLVKFIDGEMTHVAFVMMSSSAVCFFTLVINSNKLKT